MQSVIISLAAVTVVLGIMILIHEWGHFVAAKGFGVRVNVFSIGFGPRLLGWVRGHTDYRLSLLPFGGYVKMAGDNPVEERSGAPDEFLSKPRWQRVLIAIAGPAMNILLAFVLMLGLFLLGAPEPIFMSQSARIGGVLPDSPAAKAGIHPGDLITKIDGVANPKWEDVIFQVAVVPPGGKISLELHRQGQEIPLAVPNVPPQSARDEFQLLGYPERPVIAGRLIPGMPAEKAGIERGDQIISANGVAVLSPDQFASMIRESSGKPLTLLVRRNGRDIAVTLKPYFGDPGDGLKRWEIGIGFTEASVKRSHSFSDSVRRSVWLNVRYTRQIFDVLAGLFEGRVSLRQLEGPVGIARESGEAARRGPLDLLNLMAVISLNLGILNLLPIPILDGGHVLLLAIEGSLGHDLSVSVKERFVQAGLVFLLGVFVFVMYYDVLKLLPNH